MKDWLKTLGSGIAVYVAMASAHGLSACSAEKPNSAPGPGKDPGMMAAMTASMGGQPPTASGGSGENPQPTAGTDSNGGSMLDPVPDAMGQVPEPVVTTTVANCDKEYGPNGVYLYAEAAFPGLAREQLAQKLYALVEFAPALVGTSVPTGFAHLRVEPFLKDGAAGISCGAKSSPSYVNVTFYLVN